MMLKKLFKRNKKSNLPLVQGLGHSSDKSILNFNPKEWIKVNVKEAVFTDITVAGSKDISSTSVKTTTCYRTLLVHKSLKIYEVNIESKKFKAIKQGSKTFIILQNESALEIGGIINLFEVSDGECNGLNALYTIRYIEDIEQREGLKVVSIAPYKNNNLPPSKYIK
ncbi:DUF3850 domain-containing protein [Lysinibacillus sp. 1P01SD]|uniref:DUF3850 domain-containing protein n=1 Tax=Lysinibacillus sp. 1P01SD TaxID=3132285 RepID=UPI0039A246A1